MGQLIDMAARRERGFDRPVRPVPADVEAERKLTGSALLTRKAAAVIRAAIDLADFDDQRLARVIGATVHLEDLAWEPNESVRLTQARVGAAAVLTNELISFLEDLLGDAVIVDASPEWLVERVRAAAAKRRRIGELLVELDSLGWRASS